MTHQVGNSGHQQAVAGTLSFPYTATAGNTLVLLIGGLNWPTTTAPSDTLNGSYSGPDLNFLDTAFGAYRVAAYHFSNSAGGALTVTVPRSSSDAINAVMVELSSMDSTPVDKTGTLTATHWGTGSDTVGSTGTLTQADEVAFSLGIGRDQTNTFSTLPAPTGFSDLGTAYLGGGTFAAPPCHFAIQEVSATTALAPVWHGTGSTEGSPFAALGTVTYKGGGAVADTLMGQACFRTAIRSARRYRRFIDSLLVPPRLAY